MWNWLLADCERPWIVINRSANAPWERDRAKRGLREEDGREELASESYLTGVNSVPIKQARTLRDIDVGFSAIKFDSIQTERLDLIKPGAE
jgi:hypothetical protein